MSTHGLLIGEVAKRTGTTRKALRLYEEAGILLAPHYRGYRVYEPSALTWCSEAGGRAAEPPPSAFTLNSRTEIQGGERMEKRVSLCPMCEHCPEVALVGDEVQIGETGNLVVLKKDEWNVLVDAIQSGRLSKI